jgi:hypothetical protein
VGGDAVTHQVIQGAGGEVVNTLAAEAQHRIAALRLALVDSHPIDAAGDLRPTGHALEDLHSCLVELLGIVALNHKRISTMEWREISR